MTDDVAAPAAVESTALAGEGAATTADAVVADAAASEAAAEQQVSQDQPSLLSSAEGKPPDTPAPAAESEAKAEEPATATDPPKDQAAKDQAAAQASAETDPAKKEATPDSPVVDEAPAALSIEDFTLPEGARRDSDGAKAFVEVLNNAELSGRERGQALLDLHKTDIERVYREVNDYQRKVWKDLNDGWRDQLRNDQEIGGNRLHTNLSKAKGMIEEFLSPEDATSLLKHTDNNGMGNFPPFVRLLARLADRLNVFEDGIVASNPAPAKATRGPGNRGWYDTMK